MSCSYGPAHEKLGIVRWVCSLGAISDVALAVRLGITWQSARQRLSLAVEEGLLTCERPLSGRPSLFCATRAGVRACGVAGIAPVRVQDTTARHMLVCASVAATLERCYPGWRVIGEPELRREERDAGCTLASAELPAKGARQVHLHRPDIVLWPAGEAGGKPLAVEVELTLKGLPRLREICAAWASCAEVAGVLYFAVPRVQQGLECVLSQIEHAERVVVLGLDALPGIDVDGWPTRQPVRFGLLVTARTPNEWGTAPIAADLACRRCGRVAHARVGPCAEPTHARSSFKEGASDKRAKGASCPTGTSTA